MSLCIVAGLAAIWLLSQLSYLAPRFSGAEVVR